MPEKVMVVDDNEVILHYIQSALETQGYLVYPASCGKTALKWLEEPNKPGLIILDIGLPDMDGLDICQTLKKNIGTRKIPVIILTGHKDNQDRIEASMAHADMFLNKPIEQKDILEAVHTLLQNRPTEKRGPICQGSFTIDPEQHTFGFNDKVITDLSIRLFDTLYLLAQHWPNILSRRYLAAALRLQGRDREIDVLVSRLRKRLRKESGLELIETITQEGYRLNLPAPRHS